MYRPTNIKHVEGRVVEKVTTYNSITVIFFTDGTYLSFEAGLVYDDTSELKVNEELTFYDMKMLGILSEEEYNELLRQSKVEAEEKKRARELKLFNELKLKYGENNG